MGLFFLGCFVMLPIMLPIGALCYRSGYSDRRKWWIAERARILSDAESSRESEERMATYTLSRETMLLKVEHEKQLIDLRNRCINYMHDRLKTDAEYGCGRSLTVASDAINVPLIAPATGE